MLSPKTIILEGPEQAKDRHIPLLYGLPDHLAILCLARVPRQFHRVLSCVSRRWRALLCSDEWRSCRRRLNLEETWVYAMCMSKYRVNYCYVLDPNLPRRYWKCLQPIPSRCVCREGMSMETLGKKLFLLGGCSWREDATDEVYCYDSSIGKWEEAARMPTARCYFLSATIDGKIYITGGVGLSWDACKSWDIYDGNSNNWSSCQDPSLIPDIVKFFVFESKLYTIHKTWIETQYARVYDPLTERWEDANEVMTSCGRGPTVVVNGILYMLDETCGTRLMRWQKETDEWVLLGRLAQLLTKPPCQTVAVGSSIFIIGQNLSTVVVDLDVAGKVEGMLVGSSFAPCLHNDLAVIDCKVTSI
ncbi:F-box/kelch-repeat protein SKIP4 [Apostasia shenzhenica]|uniref:F-box/kelch-repeat protein SKIP4 n=1 Tax=Apostasia shenzhenica TaxID=1088818 RepID=A0A2I0AHI6_9ASPA|nr:F-box/kelch-repeat protein SKIP4 [Apostasia shenzhenica]